MTRGKFHTGKNSGNARLGIPDLSFSDGPVGTRQGASSTSMPAPLGLAATFDPKLAAKAGPLVADEVKAKGNDVARMVALLRPSRRAARCRLRKLARRREHGRVMHTRITSRRRALRPRRAPRHRRRSRRSRYGFLFNCHTGALMAQDGTVDWLRSLVRDAPKRPEKADGPFRAIQRPPGWVTTTSVLAGVLALGADADSNRGHHDRFVYWRYELARYSTYK